MLVGLSAIALLAPVASAPPAPAPAAKAPAKAAVVANACTDARPSPDSREIVICAQRPQGYRLNPDVLEARREKHNGGRPRPPERYTHDDCATVGPMGCRGGPTINLLAAAVTAATMAKRLAEGHEIGSMFETTPEPTEYQLYLEAKRRREAREAQAAVAAAVAKMKAEPAPPAADQASDPAKE